MSDAPASFSGNQTGWGVLAHNLVNVAGLVFFQKHNSAVCANNAVGEIVIRYEELAENVWRI